MNIPPWVRSWKSILATSLLFPPLALILVWARPATRLSRKIFTSIYIALIFVLYLRFFFGLHMEVDGSGVMPMLSFQRKDEAHYAFLEKNRARHTQLPLSEAIVEDARTPDATLPDQLSKPATAVPASSEQAPRRQPAASGIVKAYWTDFRGPQRNGVYAEKTEILTEWPAGGPPLAWKQPVGGGYASFVVAGGRAFTIEQRRRQEVVAAYDLETGRELWTHAWDGEFRESMGGDGPRATPTWHEERIYALGAKGEFRCLEARSGRLIWRKNILQDNQAENLQWGMSAAPLIVDDKVVVLPGGRSGQSVAAYSKLTGESIWKTLDDKQAYTSPMLVTLAGRRQILAVSARRAMGLAVEDGKLLWDFPWSTSYDVNSAQPLIIGENRVFVSAGYGHGAALVEIVSSQDGFMAKTVWQNVNMKNKFNSSVYYEGYIYGLDESILSCIDAETGERKWKGGRYGYGQLLLAGSRLLVSTESGELVLLEATPNQHSELARFAAIEGKTWNHPAIAEGRLLVRNTTEMACFRISR